jgi:hypothetical protein
MLMALVTKLLILLTGRLQQIDPMNPVVSLLYSAVWFSDFHWQADPTGEPIFELEPIAVYLAPGRLPELQSGHLYM